MNDIVAKAKVALAIDTSPERARSVALRMVELANCAARSHCHDTYTVQCYNNPKLYRDGQGWTDLRSGTREWCIGYAEGVAAYSDAPGCYRVVCAGNVIWPEEREYDEAAQWEPGDEP